jgi:hypothetical protein
MDEKVGGKEIGTSRVSGLFAQEMLKLFLNLFGGAEMISPRYAEPFSLACVPAILAHMPDVPGKEGAHLR